MSPSNNNPDLSIQALGVSRSFGAVQAVRDLNLSVDRGEIYGLVGPDGAGKTTTIRLLCGIIRPDEGEVNIGGFSLARQLEVARAQIGYLPQHFSLYDELTVAENIRFFAETRGADPSAWRERSQEILSFVGLDAFAARRAAHLSGGMKQKLSLAAALVHQPGVLLLDEPTRGLDPVTRQDFWQLLIRLVSEERTAVLVSTTYMDEATRCTRVGFLQDGQMVVEGPPDALRARLAERVIALRGAPIPLLRRLAGEDPDVEAVHTFGDRLHLRVREGTAQAVIPRLESEIEAQGGQTRRLRAVTPLLEDVFIYLLQTPR